MLLHFFQIILRNIVHLGPLSRFADRKVVLGAMATALGTAAPRLSTTLVALDEGASQYSGQVGQAPQERFLSSPESVGRFVWHVYQTSYRTGLILAASRSLVNSFFRIIKGADKISQSRERTEIQKGAFARFNISLVGPLLRNRKGAHRSSLEEQGIDSRYPTGLEDRKTLTAQRVKGMRDLRPSQRGAAMMCF